MNDRMLAKLYSMLRQVRSLAPYLALGLVVPGGSVLAFLLWLSHRDRGKALK